MKRFIEDHTRESFDVIVIGGGISGAAVAYDAASRGLSVALVEKEDFSSATSAATSKLIHGGLRYLANMEFGLVRESLKERTVLQNIAPNFIYPFPMMMTHANLPLTNNKWVVKMGMILYDILSYDRNRTWDKSKNIPFHKTINAKKVLDAQPSVKKQGLTGASLFHDCISIFPERLTFAFIKSAYAYGAKVANYTKVESFLFDKGNKITGVEVRDLLNDQMHEIHGDITINCGGPWADIILDMAASKEKTEGLRRSEGIHIITKKLLNDDSIVGSMTPNGRHFFLVPWRGHTLIGTTDKEYIGDPDAFRVTKESIMELIDEVNSSFGDGSLRYEDVLFTYGGLRPLVEEDTEETYSSSRKYEIYDNAEDGFDGLITVAGGKYTTSRNLAENVMNMVWKKIPKAMGHTITAQRYLKGSEIRDMNAFLMQIKKANPTYDARTMDYLGRHYGTEYTKILDIASKDKALAEVISEDGEILAEVVYAIQNEMAVTLRDIMLRRTGTGTLGHPGEEILEKIAAVAAKELGWDKDRRQREIAAMQERFSIPTD